MPTASAELRFQMCRRFGDCDIPGPLNYLKARGYKESGGVIFPPLGVDDGTEMPDDDWFCLLYLVHEWDYSYECPKATPDRTVFGKRKAPPGKYHPRSEAEQDNQPPAPNCSVWAICRTPPPKG